MSKIKTHSLACGITSSRLTTLGGVRIDRNNINISIHTSMSNNININLSTHTNMSNIRSINKRGNSGTYNTIISKCTINRSCHITISRGTL